MTLDHLRPHNHGGSNAETNLVTACHSCNSGRGKRSWKLFAAKVAGYVNHGVTADQIIRHIERTRYRVLDVKAAAALIAARGSFSEALKGVRS